MTKDARGVPTTESVYRPLVVARRQGKEGTHLLDYTRGAKRLTVEPAVL